MDRDCLWLICIDNIVLVVYLYWLFCVSREHFILHYWIILFQVCFFFVFLVKIVIFLLKVHIPPSTMKYSISLAILSTSIQPDKIPDIHNLKMDNFISFSWLLEDSTHNLLNLERAQWKGLEDNCLESRVGRSSQNRNRPSGEALGDLPLQNRALRQTLQSARNPSMD